MYSMQTIFIFIVYFYKTFGYVWYFKNDMLQYNIKLSFLHVQTFDPDSNKLYIIEKLKFYKKRRYSQKHDEVFSKCIHRNYPLLKKEKSVAVQN